MTKTKIQKALAAFGIVAILGMSGNAYAVQIGTGAITGGATSAINWNGTYTSNSASGTLNGVVITASVLPSLNASVSAATIALGTLNSSTYVTGSVNIEIGTNAKNGASITAKSTNSGLTSALNGNALNTLTTDGVAESYRYRSTLGTADSTVSGFTSSGLATATEINNTTAQTIYTSNKPQPTAAVDDVNFQVGAKVSAQTPAGTDYTDTVVLTVIGNF
jgi:hypothetical protein